MYVWTQVQGLSCTPSPLLRQLAGDFADRIGQLWPRPHAEFLTASTGQRHLVCLGLTREAPLDIVRAVLSQPVKRSLRSILPEPPKGLVRALEHMGETAWSEDGYRRLLELLAGAATAKLLHHAKVIDEELVNSLAAFPAHLLEAGVVSLRLKPAQSQLLMEIWQAIVARDGVQTGHQLSARLRAVDSPRKAFEILRDALPTEPPPPPFAGTERLRPLATKAAIRDAGERYDNCVGSYVSQASEGWAAFYEWLGPPGAVVEIRRDNLFGWRLEQVRLKGNGEMAEEDRPTLIAELEAMGVHVGRTMHMLQTATWQAGRGNFRSQSEQEAIAAFFSD
jgi:hypothetical protein